VLVAVPREEDVKFNGLCAGRRVPALRIGVTDSASGMLEVQDRFTIPVEELRATSRATLQQVLGPVVGARA
jgi:phosphoribosylformylglycinamidine synthase